MSNINWGNCIPGPSQIKQATVKFKSSGRSLLERSEVFKMQPVTGKQSLNCKEYKSMSFKSVLWRALVVFKLCIGHFRRS